MSICRADIVIIVPLSEELEAISRVLPFKRIPLEHCPPSLPSLYELKRWGPLHVVACVLREMANEHSAMITERCIHYLDPALVIGLGIAGSLDGDAQLGDVVVSRVVENVVFESKAVAEGHGPGPAASAAVEAGAGNAGDERPTRFKILPSANGSISVPDVMIQYVGGFPQARPAQFERWQRAGGRVRERLGLNTTVEVDRPGKQRAVRVISRERPNLVPGAIASGRRSARPRPTWST